MVSQVLAVCNIMSPTCQYLIVFSVGDPNNEHRSFDMAVYPPRINILDQNLVFTLYSLIRSSRFWIDFGVQSIHHFSRFRLFHARTHNASSRTVGFSSHAVTTPLSTHKEKK